MSTYVHCDRCGLGVLYPNDVDDAPLPQLMWKLVIPRDLSVRRPENNEYVGRLSGVHLCDECGEAVNEFIERGKP